MERVGARWATSRGLMAHLRLPFQVLLAPVFLWGWLLAGGGTGAAFGPAFVAFHVFLYGGATAFNSYYDRDEGPVGGMERPPEVAPELLPFSLAVKAAGWLLAGVVNLHFFLVYGAFALLSLAYSHSAVRLKARPIPSLLVVGGGQGVLGFFGGWAAARDGVVGALDPSGVGPIGALAAALLVLGFYPLTQLYQIEEDRARGDRSVAVAWGPRACFILALGCQAAGGLAMMAVVGRMYGWADALLVGMGLLGYLVAVTRWARCFDPRQVIPNYRRVMRLNAVAAAGLIGYLGGRIILG
jgi:4-hydroxybenzoate polyprenyltransferase